MKTNNKNVTMNGNPISLLGDVAAVGLEAPDFTLTNSSLEDVKLSDFKGKTVIISVFPSIDTPVCAIQNRTFNKKATGLSDNIVILSVSKDLPFALSRFCGAEGIKNVHMLSDYKSNDFGLKYGFLIDGLQLLSRGIVVINKNGIICYAEYTQEVSDEPNYDNVFKLIDALATE